VNHFELKGGELACEDVPLSRIAESVGTPAYVYSSATLERHFTVFRDALTAHAEIRDPLIAYALKANSNVAVVRTLARLGAGADTVSEGEIRRALAAGVPGERIVFSGVGKTAGEVAFALEAGVAEINVESEPELDLVARESRGRDSALDRRLVVLVAPPCDERPVSPGLLDVASTDQFRRAAWEQFDVRPHVAEA